MVIRRHLGHANLPKLPKSDTIGSAFYWSALTDATSVDDGKLRLQVLIS